MLSESDLGDGYESPKSRVPIRREANVFRIRPVESRELLAVYVDVDAARHILGLNIHGPPNYLDKRYIFGRDPDMLVSMLHPSFGRDIHLELGVQRDGRELGDRGR